MIARIALLLGLFVVPACLLWLGHRLRDRSAAQRGAFWGGVIGHSLALVMAITALHYPPTLWTTDTRILLAFWSMLLGGVIGAAAGALRAQARAQRQRS